MLPAPAAPTTTIAAATTAAISGRISATVELDRAHALKHWRLAAVADPELFLWVGTQYRNSAPQYATVLATVLCYLGHRESRVVLGLPKTLLGPPLLGGVA
jgi:hypothetical protein